MRHLAFLVLVLLARPALAFPIYAEGCAPPENGTTSTCNSTGLASATSGNHRYSTMECSAAATSVFTCPFQWPASDPATLIPVVWWRAKTATSGTSCWNASIACAASGDEFDNLPFPALLTNAAASTANAVATKITSVSLGAVAPNKHAAGQQCEIKFVRATAGTCTDGMTGNAYFRDADLQ